MSKKLHNIPISASSSGISSASSSRSSSSTSSRSSRPSNNKSILSNATIINNLNKLSNNDENGKVSSLSTSQASLNVSNETISNANELTQQQSIIEYSERSHSKPSNVNNCQNRNENVYNDEYSDVGALNRIKKRPLPGVFNTNEINSELSCPICYDLIDVAHVTKCGHSFCQNCIKTALEHSNRCPKCNTPCSIKNDVFPNFSLNTIIERYKEDNQMKKTKVLKANTPAILDFLNYQQNDLTIEDVNRILVMMSQRKAELTQQNRKIAELLIYDFIKNVRQIKQEELNKVQHELFLVEKDCEIIEKNLNDLNVKLFCF
jgi:hypothetical protein